MQNSPPPHNNAYDYYFPMKKKEGKSGKEGNTGKNIPLEGGRQKTRICPSVYVYVYTHISPALFDISDNFPAACTIRRTPVTDPLFISSSIVLEFLPLPPSPLPPPCLVPFCLLISLPSLCILSARVFLSIYPPLSLSHTPLLLPTTLVKPPH